MTTTQIKNLPRKKIRLFEKVASMIAKEQIKLEEALLEAVKVGTRIPDILFSNDLTSHSSKENKKDASEYVTAEIEKLMKSFEK